MRVIGLDVHRNFAQVAILETGLVKDHGRFAMEREAVLRFAQEVLTKRDDVVLEATGNTSIIVRLLQPFVHRVVIANPLQVRAIAWAKVKTDKIDAATLARLHAARFLPEVWMPTEEVELQRRIIAERTQLVSQMTRLKNRIQSILHANLIPQVTGRIFGRKGRARIEAMPLPADQMRMALRHYDELERLAAELAIIDRDLAQHALDDPNVRRLMTIGGVHSIVAASVLAAIGDIKRFSSPEKLVSYLGLNPSVHQSGDHPAFHGHITHQGRGHARGMLVEAAWSLAPGPGATERVLPPHQPQARQASGRGRHRQKARCPCVAHADQERGLRLDAASVVAVESSATRAEGRPRLTQRRQQARAGARLQPQGREGQGACMARNGRTGIPPLRCRLEGPATRQEKARSAGRKNLSPLSNASVSAGRSPSST